MEFKAGDRVVLTGLKNCAYLNGRHGCVASSIKESNGRYRVDLDLLDPNKPYIGLKPQSLQREAPLPPETTSSEDDGSTEPQIRRRAGAANGILTEEYGRPMSFLLDSLRLVVATVFSHRADEVTINDFNDLNQLRNEGGQRGLVILNDLIGMGWSHWQSPGMFRTPDDKGVYLLLCDLVRHHCEALKDDTAVPQDVKDMNKLMVTALDDVRAVKGWNVRIHDDFWVVGMDDEGTFLVPDLNRSMVYKVLGVRNAIYPMLQCRFRRPVIVRLTIIPFWGRLVYDGVITGTMVEASVALSEKLAKNVKKAQDEGRVIDRLRQLEVPGGSLEGLPRQGTDLAGTSPSADNMNAATMEQPPPTSQEAALVEQFKSSLNALPESDNAASPEGMWVFRRFGYTEKDNPTHNIMLLGGTGMPLATFATTKLEPTSVEIMMQAIQVFQNQAGRGRASMKRPNLLCIDESKCFQRVKFLLENVVHDMKVEYYMPPTKEETDAYSASSRVF